MKKALTEPHRMHFSTRLLTSIAMVVLGLGLWVATVPMSVGQETQALEQNLPRGTTVANAGKADLLAAVLSAVKKNSKSAPQIVRAATKARPELAKDILRTAFRGVGGDDCNLLQRIYRETIAANPKAAKDLTELAIELAPNCAGSFGSGGGGAGGEGHGDEGEGNFGSAPGNLNPPPGSIGGGGGQGNVVVVCYLNQTLFVTPERAQELVNQGATVGACATTTTTNN